MQPIHLFSLASRQADWLSVRQATVAQNVANADTPKYSAVDVEPFSEVFSQTRLELAATNPGHMAPSGLDAATADVRREKAWETSHSGNSVSLEQEMIKAGDIHTSFSLNRSIVAAFGRMLTSAVKG
ncbi:flagellar basal body rod protein FlgB [Pleomorphomonas sp. PLEO]|uniref:flagellar basal body rod protein FlgB n=1 Tax=Pleomorphomonas sp. PLEO TaxID=3239306 RepID=UPI00351E8035